MAEKKKKTRWIKMFDLLHIFNTVGGTRPANW